VTTDVIRFRLAAAQDIQFLIRTWIESFKAAHGAGILRIDQLTVPCECGRPIRYDFSAVMEVTLASLLQRPGVTTWMAYHPHEQPPNDLYGYLVSETGANVPSYVRGEDGESRLEVATSELPLIHYVFVKRYARERGIARALFAAAGIDPDSAYLYTCKTSNLSRLEARGKIPRDSRWFPLSVRFAKGKTPP
jgi:hypothetical protein